MYIQDITQLKKTIVAIQSEYDINALLLFASDNNKLSVSEIQSVLNLNHKPLLGGIFPEIIADGERKETGFLIIPLYEQLDVAVFEIKECEKSVATRFEEWIANCNMEIGSVLCFYNALWSQKTSFMNEMYDALGPMVHYLGGGAGSLSFQSFPCVFANRRIAEHAAVIGLMENTVSIGVAHGWQPITEAIKVTETKGNSIVSLNWKPAFEVYKATVEKHSGRPITEENFFDMAKAYPLGLVRLDDEMIIRDPFAAKNGVIHILDEAPEGEYIRIMHGDILSMLHGAQSALDQSETGDNEDVTHLCINCISRVLYMQDDFVKELSLLNKNYLTNGILSIGELANPGNSTLEIFNKTVVVAQWKKIN
jgi:hypothetical protein